MKAITSDETKKKLLEQLRNAVRIQSALWSICFLIEALLDDKCDAIWRVNQLAINYVGKKISGFDLEEILFGREAEKSALHLLAKLTKDSRRELLLATQNAVWLQNAFRNEAESIAATRNCDLEIVLDFLSELTVEADSPEILEIHQTWFFGEIRLYSKADETQSLIELGLASRTENGQVGDEKKTWLIPEWARSSRHLN
jgi:hypothetical protein